MEKVGLHFERSEFRCRGLSCCGHSAPVSRELVAALELLRQRCIDRTGDTMLRMIINSGFRCVTHNREIGSDDKSYHIRGEAADIVVTGMSPMGVAYEANRIDVFRNGGIGVYASHVHVDIRRDGPARWSG